MRLLPRGWSRRDVDPDRLDSFDPTLVERLAAPIDVALSAWFRHEIRGLERVPVGPALLVGNHNSGVSFLEAIGFGARWYHRGPGLAQPPWHGLAHDQIVDMPLLGPFLTRVGAVRAGHDTAARAFAAGRKVVVFPGGNQEAFRPWRDRHRIVFGGHTGFVRLALRHQVPIVPVVFHGGHSGFFVLSDNRRLARWIGAKRFLRADTWPLYVGLPWGVALGPWFHLPLPVRCTTEVLDPIPLEHGPEAEHDPTVVQTLYDLVTTRMQAALDRLAAEQEGPRGR